MKKLTFKLPAFGFHYCRSIYENTAAKVAIHFEFADNSSIFAD